MRVCRTFPRRMAIAIAAVFSLFFAITFPAAGQHAPETILVKQTSDGFIANSVTETLRVSVCNDSVVHVVAAPAPISAPSPKPWILPSAESCPGAKFQFEKNADMAVLKTGKLNVALSLSGGYLTFTTPDGKRLLREYEQVPRTYDRDIVNGEHTYHVEDRFSIKGQEAFFGLGQHQSGMFNYSGSTVELGQNNTDIAIPLLVSSNGYGLFWNTASLTYVDNRFPFELNFRSLAGQSIDYYFLYGPEMDDVIHQYRNLTGHTPMLPKWAYGFFQSKDRYKSQQELLDIAHRYRAEHIPMDTIVQDWFWWIQRGDPEYRAGYPDVPAALKTLHDEHVHAMISVWAIFDPQSKNAAKLSALHYDIAGANVYDPTNPKASDFYWQNLVGKVFAQGWDAFWLDSSEPEEYWPHGGDANLRDKHLAIGNGAEYTNIFPLMHTLGVQRHWKETNSPKRVFLLTRSAFAGQQRVGAAVWSGDIMTTYWALDRQVPAGLNLALSGYPYWTTDIGGYAPTGHFSPDDPEYQNLYARWFEFGVFCPIFRTHGHRTSNEIWSYGPVEPILIEYDKLRYRLMPYIYSLAWRVHDADYTIQRPLVMDWRSDPETWNIGDQFMFGPAILVNPVLKKNVTERSLYLPTAPLWYDFWTGTTTKGGQTVESAAPLNRIPLYVRAGSIVPMGPEIEYAEEQPDGPIELRVYRGADGQFTLYEDEGDNYDYEKGEYAEIPITWSEKNHALTIGARTGHYPGIPKEREFRVVLVSPNHGVGEAIATHPDRIVHYTGETVTLSVQ